MFTLLMRVDEKNETLEGGFKAELHGVEPKVGLFGEDSAFERVYGTYLVVDAKFEEKIRALPIGQFVEVTVRAVDQPEVEAPRNEDMDVDAAIRAAILNDPEVM